MYRRGRLSHYFGERRVEVVARFGIVGAEVEGGAELPRRGGEIAGLRERVERELKAALRMRSDRLDLLKRTIADWSRAPIAALRDELTVLAHQVRAAAERGLDRYVVCVEPVTPNSMQLVASISSMLTTSPRDAVSPVAFTRRQADCRLMKLYFPVFISDAH